MTERRRPTRAAPPRQGGDSVQALFAEAVGLLRAAAEKGISGAQAALDKLVNRAKKP